MKGNKMLDWIKRLFYLPATGTEKIQAIVGEFTATVDRLRSAIDEIDSDITSNQSVIATLKAENTVLGATKVTGLKLINGIKTLLGD